MTTFILGSKNPSKVEALENILHLYRQYKDAQVEGVEVDTGVSDQPMSMDETITGAKNRAKLAFASKPCTYSFGIESGFMHVPHTKDGYVEFTACAIYDGKEFHLGFSPGWECPSDIMKHVLEGKDLNQATLEAGYSTDPEIGKSQGLIGILTKGRMNRTEYTKAAVIMAMIHLDR